MRRSLGFAILTAAVIILPWLFVSVAANLQAAPAPVPIRINATCVGEVCHSNSTSVAVFTLTGQANPEAFPLALLAIGLFCVGLSYLAWRRGVRGGKGDNLWNTSTLLLVVGLFYFALLLFPSLRSDSQPGPAQAPVQLWFVPLSLVAIAGGMSLIWAIRRSGGIHLIPTPASGGSSDSSLAGVLQGAISSLRTGSDPRSAIIRCYGSMVELLQKGGVTDSPSMTAREFEAACQHIFSVKRDLIHRLTALFERARYSDEDMGAPQASEAEEVLTELKDSVGGRASAR